jgi:vanillate monooxygenase ferredoxin subunit
MLTLRIARKYPGARDICVFELVDPVGGPLPAFSAGAHIDVHLSDGMVRQYSLCNAPSERSRYVLGVLLAPDSRGGSKAMHALQEGAAVSVSEPRNHFALDPTATHTILLAGGIGITPLLCMAEELASKGASFELHYGVRSLDRIAFEDRLAARHLAGYVRCYADDALSSERLDLESLLERRREGAHIYVCGPAGFIERVLAIAKKAQWPAASVHREYFSGAQTAAASGTFQLKLASTGQVITVSADQTAVEALAAQGIAVPTSCEQGVCGTCVTRVLEGTPDHRDLYLTDSERAQNDQFLPCCSRSCSAMLIIDL